MRVAVIAKTATFGGVAQYVARLAEALTLAGHKVDLIYLRQHAELPRSDGVNIRLYLSGWRAGISQAVGVLFLRTIFRDAFTDENAPDPFSWATSPFFLRLSKSYDRVVYGDESLGAFTIVANRLMKLRYFVVSHEGLPPSYLPIRWAQRILLTHSEGVFFSSPLVAARGLPVHPLKGLERFVPLARPVEQVVLPKSRFILFDTRWSPRRDSQMILQIMQMLEGIPCVVAGSFSSPDLRSKFDDAVRGSALTDRLQIRTNLSDDQVSELYRNATAYVRWPEFTDGLASEKGIGWGVVRALESGCPVVLERELGGAGLIRDGYHGFVVEHHATEYVRALNELLRNSSLVESMAMHSWELARSLSIQKTSVSLREI